MISLEKTEIIFGVFVTFILLEMLRMSNVFLLKNLIMIKGTLNLYQNCEENKKVSLYLDNSWWCSRKVSFKDITDPYNC